MKSNYQKRLVKYFHARIQSVPNSGDSVAAKRLEDNGYSLGLLGGIIKFITQDDFWVTRVHTLNKMADLLIEPRDVDNGLEVQYQEWAAEGGLTWCEHKKPKDSCLICVPPPSRESCGRGCKGREMWVHFPADQDDQFNGNDVRLLVPCPRCKPDDFVSVVRAYGDASDWQKEWMIAKFGKREEVKQ